MTEDLNVLVEYIAQWAEDRNIIEGSHLQAQMLKLTEEMGELAGAIAKGRTEEAYDAVGDMMVVLIIIAKQLDTDLGKCLAGAYEEIRHRKGKMVNGVFVKEE